MRKPRAAAVAVALLGCVACSRPAAVEHSTAAPAANASTKTAASTKAPAADQPATNPQMRGWLSDREYGYRFRTSSRIELEDKALLYDFDLAGLARVVPLEVEANSASFYLKLADVKFVSRVPGSQPEFDRVSGELEAPYFFEMTGGLVTSANIAKDLHPLAAAVFRSLSASLQFAAVEGPPRAFTLNEFDTTGEYEAQYSPSSDPLVWTKRKQKYLGILLGEYESKQAREVSPKITHSEGEFKLSPEGRPLEIRTRDELELASAQAPLRSKTVVSLMAEPVRDRKLPNSALLALKAKTERVAANAPYQSAADRKSLDEAKIDGRTFEHVVSDFEQIANRAKAGKPQATLEARRAELKKQSDEESKLFVALGALLRARPGTVQRAVGKVRAKSPASDALLDALGSAGSAEAQKALISFVKDSSTTKMVRARAMLSLSRTQNPSPESVQTLLSLASDEQLGTQALYGIGNYARAFASEGKVKDADALGKVLLRRLESAQSEMKLIEALRALANSGFDPAFDKVKSYLKDPREQVRVDAVAALALMSIPEVNATLVERLTLDSARKVRLAALEAIGARTANDVLVAGLEANVASDDPHVRYRAVEIMIRWLPKRKELRASVERVAKNDTEQQIRELAKAAL